MEQKEKSRQSIDYIINCSIDEFARAGRLVSLNSICQNHNISKGKLYHHFSSKDELLCACVCYCLDSLRNNIDSFQVDSSLSVHRIFHDYYSDRMEHWIQFPNQLTVLRLAYVLSQSDVFSEDSLNEIRKHQLKWRQSKKKKILEIIHSNNNKLRMSDDGIADMLLLMYENTFQVWEDKMITASRNNNKEATVKFAKELIDYHDTIINTVLYGVLED